MCRSVPDHVFEVCLQRHEKATLFFTKKSGCVCGKPFESATKERLGWVGVGNMLVLLKKPLHF